MNRYPENIVSEPARVYCDITMKINSHRLLLCAFAAWLAVLLPGCSDSGSDTQPSSDNPFLEPHPDGTTTIARLGYAVARDLADDLLSMQYLQQYYELDSDIALLLEADGPASDVTVVCPEGGNGTGTISIFSFDVIFDNCQVAGNTLSGGLTRVADFTVFGLGSTQNITVSFNNFSISSDERGLLELTGVSTRRDQDFTITECVGITETTQEVTNTMDSVRLEYAEIQTFISVASWQQSVVNGPQLLVGDSIPECVIFEDLRFEGTAMAVSSVSGSHSMILEKSGDISRGAESNPDSTATLSADFGDNSSLILRMKSDADSEVQVDIVSDGAAISFFDTYRFRERTDIPPIIGER